MAEELPPLFDGVCVRCDGVELHSLSLSQQRRLTACGARLPEPSVPAPADGPRR